MFTRALRTSPSRDRRWWKGLAPIGVALAIVASPLALLPSVAQATLGGASPYNASDGVKDATAGDPRPDVPTGSSDNAYSGSGGGAKEDSLCPAVEPGSIPNNKPD